MNLTPSREPLDWRSVALITSTLFLGLHVWRWELLYGSVLSTTVLSGVGSILVTAAFFLPVALSCQEHRMSLWELASRRVGTVPSAFLRFTAIYFVLTALADILAVYSRLAHWVFRRDLLPWESTAVSTGIAVFLLLTALSAGTNLAGLARFTVRLSIAVLIAALLRARDGIPFLLEPIQYSGEIDDWFQVSKLAYTFGPFVVLAAGYGSLLCSREAVKKWAIWGILVPLFAAVAVATCVGIVQRWAGLGHPKMPATVLAALWGGAAPSSLSPRVMLVGLTAFGFLRICWTAVVSALPQSWLNSWRGPTSLAVLVVWISWPPSQPFGPDLYRWELRACAYCFAALAGLLTAAHFNSAKEEHRDLRKFEWPGTMAILTGIATGFIAAGPIDYKAPSGFIPAYLVALSAQVVLQQTTRLSLFSRRFRS